ncbi:hypothetical protein R3W88_024148 [Solanum pinnatisectum]|uniref:Leucine-rich repeat-containing N-terminal plant-type domain-containing protein n=1 Tax=Solanum pinnatisectum TaxID=50273 RepID=A0AAV9M2G6_9SOLN|nr:hypothetical protein R3W88_024148 [Solanum pinnatisectum]
MTTLYFLWLFLIPLFQILSGNDIFLVSSQCLDDQKSLLLQLKGSLWYDSTLSNKLAKWNQKTSECCNWDGVTCDLSGHVIALELDDETISSGIENASALFSLQYLERLNLAYNRFSVGIPVGIGNLTNLKYLNLSNAGFVGQIPMMLSRLTKLVTLDLSTLFPYFDQRLKLENPNLRHFIDNSTELRELYLDGVDLSSQRTEWCQSLSLYLPYLIVLSLRACQISGPIDESLSKLQILSIIRLDQNNLSTTVPGYFANFTNLTTLSLDSCNLQGAFPKKIFQVQFLEILDLSNNKLLSGSIPSFPRNGSLRTISLSNTNFSGSLPESISNLQNLSKIELFNCNFTGPVPSTMGNLINLVHLDFSLNNFTGSIPYFQRSKKLTHLDLSHNGLTGLLSPAHFEGLSELVYINLGNNLLNGILPEYIFEIPSLQMLLLNSNQFVGQVNDFHNASSFLYVIDLSNNHLNGSIPKSMFEIGMLKVLSLSSNFFSGTVPLDLIGKLSNLTRLELSYNNLTVDASSINSTSFIFPQLRLLKLASCRLQKFPDLKSQSRMIHLDLSDNQIRGAIPNWIWGIGSGNLAHLNLSFNQLEYAEQPYNVSSYLVVLDLHSNKLKGDLPIPPSFAAYLDYSSNNFSNSIPLDIGNYLGIFLSLANNRLAGRIPESICNASYLQVLDFSNNALSGTIPPCLLEYSTNLGVLNLGNNKLNGVIPDSFPIGCALQTLDLSENKLQGRLPKSLVNCELLEVLNVGNNKLVDRFPCMLRNSNSLRVLVLHSNQFNGSVQCDATRNNWKSLQIIDIASNNFTGVLNAEFFSNWKGMMVADDYVETGRNHIQYKFLQLSNLYYQDTVTITIKGLEWELVKILRVYTAIDFSSNRFQGVIPDTIGNLSSLYVLNLSHNALEGPIPKSIGKLQMLESLDLSTNHLSGEIPSELASLTFLAALNLSFNKLFGKIPSTNQFQTFSADSFEGNSGLCGLPINNSCQSNGSESLPPPTSLPDSDDEWKFIFAAVGYVVGAANTISLLWFYEPVKKWFDKHTEKCLFWFSRK